MAGQALADACHMSLHHRADLRVLKRASQSGWGCLSATVWEEGEAALAPTGVRSAVSECVVLALGARAEAQGLAVSAGCLLLALAGAWYCAEVACAGVCHKSAAGLLQLHQHHLQAS